MTLIEVTAGLLILSTLLVTSVVAFQGHVRQMERAQRAMVAIRATDELLDAWYAAGIAVPWRATGQFPADPSLVWRTNLVAGEQNTDQVCQVVRLRVTDTFATNPDAALVEVDVVVPAEDPPHE